MRQTIGLICLGLISVAGAASTAIAQTTVTSVTDTNGTVHRRYAFKPWPCEAEWNETCETTHEFVADENYQMCRMEVVELTRDGHDPWFNKAPTQFFTNDPQKPDRFRAYSTTIHAGGNNDYFNHRGAKMVVQITTDEVPVDISELDRFKAGCTLEPHDT